ncbi:MAG: zf-TFIIB domain-containing protein [Betaproteobacteria bacterium]|nr:zf-TFIIB domain-containing protein [Betaproteobacteria bacterium]
MKCPSCRQDMLVESIPREYSGEIVLDICYHCHVIWFDQFESAALPPAGVMALFRKLHQHDADARLPLAQRMTCSRCPAPLAEAQDFVKAGRITYHRCPAGHGRLTSFVQFLREKQFVRTLTAPEINQLKATVKQVKCSSCGGPIDLARDSACGYCRAPISVLDAEAVEKALAKLSAAEAKRGQVDPEKLAALQKEDEKRRRELARMSGAGQGHGGMWQDTSGGGVNTVDLVAGGIAILVALLS